MSAIQGTPGDDPATAKRCVLLCPGSEEPADRDLPAALNRRGLTVVLVSDPARAMLEVVRHGALALIVAEPDRVRGAAELVEAVRAYRPRTVCWQYNHRQLAPINGRLGGVKVGTTAPGQAPGSAPGPDSGPLVTADELAMLLGPPGTATGD